MNKILLCILLAAVLVTGFVLYRSHVKSHLSVTPDAKKEIEKAKRR